ITHKKSTNKNKAISDTIGRGVVSPKKKILKSKMKSRDLPRVPKAALQFVEQKKKDWLQSLPPGLKQCANDTIIQKKGHNLEQKSKCKALKITRAMMAMPDLMRALGHEKASLKEADKERKEKYEASTKKVTDMKFLADAFDELDDAWMDGNRDYYSIAYPNRHVIFFY
ncbi:hypothetical protein RFI_35670, partial [Reticulomyxa filosa]